MIQLTWSERVARLHAIEDADDFQYGVVWRFAGPDVQNVPLGPPDGDGWELNIDFGEGGLAVTVPSWAEGDVLLQSTHWRRKSPGMWNGHPQRKIHRRVRWDGDPKPRP